MEELTKLLTAGTPNNINVIMSAYHLTIKDISTTFNIPYRTVQNWAGGVSSPPPYILRMITIIIRYSKTIEFINVQNEHLFDLLDRASDLLHDERYKEAISLIDNA